MSEYFKQKKKKKKEQTRVLLFRHYSFNSLLSPQSQIMNHKLRLQMKALH